MTNNNIKLINEVVMFGSGEYGGMDGGGVGAGNISI